MNCDVSYLMDLFSINYWTQRTRTLYSVYQYSVMNRKRSIKSYLSGIIPCLFTYFFFPCDRTCSGLQTMNQSHIWWMLHLLNIVILLYLELCFEMRKSPDAGLTIDLLLTLHLVTDASQSTFQDMNVINAKYPLLKFNTATVLSSAYSQATTTFSF